jgi:hypothetical protein
MNESTVFIAQDLWTQEFVEIPPHVFLQILKHNNTKDFYGNPAYTLNCGWVDLESGKVFQRFVTANGADEKKFRAFIGAVVQGEI